MPEVLIALFLFSTSIMAMLQYQQALNASVQQQREQREAWRVAAQSLLGVNTAGWNIMLNVDPGPAGCLLQTTQVMGPSGSQAQLQLLNCDNTP